MSDIDGTSGKEIKGPEANELPNPEIANTPEEFRNSLDVYCNDKKEKMFNDDNWNDRAEQLSENRSVDEIKGMMYSSDEMNGLAQKYEDAVMSKDPEKIESSGQEWSSAFENNVVCGMAIGRSEMTEDDPAAETSDVIAGAESGGEDGGDLDVEDWDDTADGANDGGESGDSALDSEVAGDDADADGTDNAAGTEGGGEDGGDIDAEDWDDTADGANDGGESGDSALDPEVAGDDTNADGTDDTSDDSPVLKPDDTGADPEHSNEPVPLRPGEERGAHEMTAKERVAYNIDNTSMNANTNDGMLSMSSGHIDNPVNDDEEEIPSVEEPTQEPGLQQNTVIPIEQEDDEESDENESEEDDNRDNNETPDQDATDSGKSGSEQESKGFIAILERNSTSVSKVDSTQEQNNADTSKLPELLLKNKYQGRS